MTVLVLKFIFTWACSIIATEAVIEIIVESKFFMGLRAWLTKKNPGFLGKLFSCGYCMSVWFGLLGLVLPGEPIGLWLDHPIAWWLDCVIRIMVLHRLSNVHHELLQRWFDRQLISIVFHHHQAGFEPDKDTIIEVSDAQDGLQE